MGCIEISALDRSKAVTARLIETWDVLKCLFLSNGCIISNRLIETWDVLK